MFHHYCNVATSAVAGSSASGTRSAATSTSTSGSLWVAARGTEQSSRRRTAILVLVSCHNVCMTTMFDALIAPDIPPRSAGSVPDHVFRYMDTNGLLYTIRDKELRLNSWSRMNDPRESKQWRSSGALQAIGGYTETEMYRRIDNILRRSARLMALTADRSAHPSASSRDLFHRGWANSALWAHYADNHQGVCLVLGAPELVETVHNSAPDIETVRDEISDGVRYVNAGAITYSDQPITIDLTGKFSSQDSLDEAIERYLDTQWKQFNLHMTKTRDWAYENEWRIATIDPNLADDQLDTPEKVPLGDCLKAVILGDGHPAPRIIADGIRAAFDSRAPEFFQCNWSDGAPSLTPLD